MLYIANNSARLPSGRHLHSRYGREYGGMEIIYMPHSSSSLLLATSGARLMEREEEAGDCLLII